MCVNVYFLAAANSLSDGVLSKLSRTVSHNEVVSAARELMGLRDAEVDNIKTNNRKCEDASFEILKCWRESSGGGVQELYQIFSTAVKQGINIAPEALEYLKSTEPRGQCYINNFVLNIYMT